MDVSTPSIFSEIYLQYLENTKIFDILVKHHIIVYFRYVDDILLVYKNNVTNIHVVLDTFNNLTSKILFTMEEVDNGINILDTTITKVNHKISFNIYRKHTATESISPYDSCHPPRTQASSNQIPDQPPLNISHERNKQKKGGRMTQ
jgi:hypothetical protein